MKTFIVAAALALLAACSTVGETALKAGTTGAVRFTPEDVDAAIKIAQEAKDPVAEACFKAIRNHTGDAQPGTVVKGVVSAYAAARAKVRDAKAGLADDVHVACSPLIVDAGVFAAQFNKLLLGAAAAVPGVGGAVAGGAAGIAAAVAPK